jgi:hypothetical protein
MKKQNFYFTFGQKYADEKHPKYPNAHPNGWVRVEANSYAEARSFAVYSLFGEYFSNQYTEENWKPEFFPAGEIAVHVI